MPELTSPPLELNQDSLFVWNEGLAGATQPQRFAKLDLDCHYKGLVCVAVAPPTLSAQRSTLNVPDIKPAAWPDTDGALQKVLDTIDIAVSQLAETHQMLKAIALYATSQNINLGSELPLQTWLASTAVSTVRAGIATPAVTARADLATLFADTMRDRCHLFAELERLVVERRMVFLLGSRQSGLEEFLEGFQNFVETSRSTQLEHVTVRFSSEHFRQFYERYDTDLLDYRELDCLLASIAFAAAIGLKEKAGKFPQNYLTPQMLDKPEVFAKFYLKDATQHNDHWQCIRHLMVFLTGAAQEAGIIGKITVFLPFNEVEEIINGDDNARFHLRQGLGALRQQLEMEPDQCPRLGLVLAVQDLAIDLTNEERFLKRVLTIPPLSREELGKLLQFFWGNPANNEELDVIEDYSGGDPWFVFLLLRCLELVTETRSKVGELGRGKGAITEAYQFALKVVRGDEPDDSALKDLRAHCDDYLDDCLVILRQYQGELGARKVLNTWKQPANFLTQRREIEKFMRAWIRMGLVYTKARGTPRGGGLESLHEYPVYQFCQAGKLPFAFAERVLTAARVQ